MPSLPPFVNPSVQSLSASDSVLLFCFFTWHVYALSLYLGTIGRCSALTRCNTRSVSWLVEFVFALPFQNPSGPGWLPVILACFCLAA
jgi:hypothetical protein